MGRPSSYKIKKQSKAQIAKQLKQTMTSHSGKQPESEVIEYIKANGVGPNPYSNWLVYPGVIPKGRILMSAYPYKGNRTGAGESKTTMRDYEDQVRAFPGGVTYICLQEKKELDRLRLPMYYGHKTMKDMKKKTGVKSLEFENELQIPDMYTADDNKVADYVRKLAVRYLNGESFVIHCLGGHGRTGTICGILLGYLLLNAGFDHSVDDILLLTQRSHDMRKKRGMWIECPQGSGQRGQIQRLYRQQAMKMKVFIPEINVNFSTPAYSAPGPSSGVWSKNAKGVWSKGQPSIKQVPENDPEWNQLPLLNEKPVVKHGCLSSLMGVLRACWGGSSKAVPVSPVSQPPPPAYQPPMNEVNERGVDVGAWDLSEAPANQAEDIDLSGFWGMGEQIELRREGEKLIDDLLAQAPWYASLPTAPKRDISHSSEHKKPIYQLAPLKIPIALSSATSHSGHFRDSYGSRKKPPQIDFEIEDLY
jgi:hypothetical protein